MPLPPAAIAVRSAFRAALRTLGVCGEVALDDFAWYRRWRGGYWTMHVDSDPSGWSSGITHWKKENN